MKKKLAVVVGALAAVYMFVPEPTDAIPILGWLDEGMAGGLLLWSLKTLELTPSNVLAKLSAKKKPAALDDKRDDNNATAGARANAGVDELGSLLDAQLNAQLNARLRRLKQTA